MFKTKMLMVGPCEAGKSTIANFLSEALESVGGNYWPTQGVRVVEFEVPGMNVNGKHVDGEVELWDVSGNRKFEQCWPAVARDASGVIFVYNQDHPDHGRELEIWHKHFVQQHALKDSQCMLLCHRKPNTADRDVVTLPSAFDTITRIVTTIEDDPEGLRAEFSRFLAGLLGAMSESRDQEELNIMNER